MKVHELIGAPTNLLLSSINTKNEHELSEHTSGTTQLDITIIELSLKGTRQSKCTLDR